MGVDQTPVEIDEGTISRSLAGRLIALFFAGSGLLTIIAIPLPQPVDVNRPVLLAVGLFAVAIGAWSWFAPWARWPRSANLWLIPVAFGLIGVGNVYSGDQPYTYSVFFIVTYVLVGVAHPRWTSLLITPLAVAAYVAPLFFIPGDVAANVSTAAVNIPICILVAESLAWRTNRLARATRGLRDSEEGYRRLVEMAPDAVLVHRDGVILFGNDAAVRLLSGGDAAGLVGRTLAGVFPLPGLESPAPPVGPGRALVEADLVRPGGDHVTVELSSSPVTYRAEPAVQVVVRDITTRSLEAEAKFQALVERLPAIVYTADFGASGQWRYVSPGLESLLGFTATEWVNDQDLFFSRIHRDDRETYLDAERRSASTREPFAAEYRLIARDGTHLWFRDEATVVEDGDGGLFLQGVMYDITARKLAEDQLREAEAKFRALVEHIPAVLYVHTADQTLTPLYVSPQIEALVGVAADRFVREGLWRRLIHPDDGDRVEARRTAVAALEPFVVEYRMVTADGLVKWIRDQASVIPSRPGMPAMVQGVMFDVTEWKLAEESLRQSERREREAVHQLQALHEMKNTFLAAVSHELRTPLTSVLGIALTLQHSTVSDEEERDLLDRLSANARKLERLLSDLLDVERLARGFIAADRMPTDLAGLVEGVVEGADFLRGRTVRTSLERFQIDLDPAKVERIVENLVANAVKHAPEAVIWVRVEASEDGALIAVEDDGPGVPEELRTHIFEPFRQGPSRSPHSPGTGIGLALVARFAELHGGRAWVQDRAEGGSSFRVFLPSGPPEGLAVGAVPRAE